MDVKYEVTGMDDLKREINSLLDEMREVTGKGVQESAERLAEVVWQNTPEGPTGNLKRAVGTKPLPDRWGYPTTTLVGLDYTIAPHQHLVEYGTGPRHHRSGKSVGSMPAQGFFRRAIDQAGYRIEIMRKHCKGPVQRRGG